MNKYTFLYCSDSAYLCATYCATRLSAALRSFWRDSLRFAAPVTALLPQYEVVNAEGKVSFRVLPEKYLKELV